MIELLLIVAILLVVFGAKKLRNAGSDLGAAVKGFRTSLRGEKPAPEAAPTPAVQAKVHDPDPDPDPDAGHEPDAEFPEVLAARSRRGDGGPRA